MRLLFIMLVLLPQFTMALTSETRLPEAQEQQAHAIFKQIRCVVCSGESINDSKADLAKELRILIREQITGGKDEGQIISYITERYGDSILMRPPLTQDTWLLWFAPLILLLFGAGFLAFFFKQRVEK